MTLRRTGLTAVTAVHSVERIVFTVPDIESAQKFYTAFGMDVKSPASTVGPRVDLYAHGAPPLLDERGGQRPAQGVAVHQLWHF